MTIAYWNMKAGAVISLHEHVHEMIVNVIRGQLQSTVGNETRVLEPGVIAIIPSHVPIPQRR